MAYVVVDTATRCKISHPRTRVGTWATERAAKAAATRISKIQDFKGGLVVMDWDTYKTQVPMIEVINLMSGKPVTIPADTPWSCRPDSESYWSA